MNRQVLLSLLCLFLTIGWCQDTIAQYSPVQAPDFNNGGDFGDKNDVLRINSDGTNYDTGIKLHSANSRSWNIGHEKSANYLFWSYSTSSNWREGGVQWMSLSSDGRLDLNGGHLVVRNPVMHEKILRFYSTTQGHAYIESEGDGLGIIIDSKGANKITLNDFTEISGGLRIPGRYSFGQNKGAIEMEVPESGYNAIRAYQGSNNMGIIHFFDDGWLSGDLAKSGGAVNICGNKGVTLGLHDAPVLFVNQETGRAGIGVADPAEALEVSGVVKASGFMGGSADSYFAGNIGVGTNNPDKGKLHVVGSFHVENTAGHQTFHVSAGKQLVFVGDSAYVQYQASQNDTTSVIHQGDFSLWVSKGIVSEDFAIEGADDWADFVFSDDYNLPSIEEVDAYIQKNGHLPEMISEKEVKAHGYSLHEINKKLLQKIEELTLYTIDQEEKIRRLDFRYQNLADRLLRLEQQLKK